MGLCFPTCEVGWRPGVRIQELVCIGCVTRALALGTWELAPASTESQLVTTRRPGPGQLLFLPDWPKGRGCISKRRGLLPGSLAQDPWQARAEQQGCEWCVARRWRAVCTTKQRLC